MSTTCLDIRRPPCNTQFRTRYIDKERELNSTLVRPYPHARIKASWRASARTNSRDCLHVRKGCSCTGICDVDAYGEGLDSRRHVIHLNVYVCARPVRHIRAASGWLNPTRVFSCQWLAIIAPMPVGMLVPTIGRFANTNTHSVSANRVLNTVKSIPNLSVNMTVAAIVGRNANPTVALGFRANSITELDGIENVMINGAPVRHGVALVLVVVVSASPPISTTPTRFSPVPETRNVPNVAEVTANQFWRGPSCMPHCSTGVPTCINSGSSRATSSRGTTSTSVTICGMCSGVQSRNNLGTSPSQLWRGGSDSHDAVYASRR